jgi:hypothetical protein
MNFNRNNLFALLLLILATALYRVIPYGVRPEWLGAPQFAMAIFAGSVIKDKKWAFALPIFSMLASDLVMQLMYWKDPSLMPGFYKGQLLNYILIASLTVIGFFISRRKPIEIGAGILAAPTVYFLLSNFIVWAGNGGWHHPKTFAGLMESYTDGLPFYKMDILGTLVWGTVLFGMYHLMVQSKKVPQTVKA